MPYPVLSGTNHTLCGVHALPGRSPLSGKRTESTRGFTPGPLTANLTGCARKLQVGFKQLTPAAVGRKNENTLTGAGGPVETNSIGFAPWPRRVPLPQKRNQI